MARDKMKKKGRKNKKKPVEGAIDKVAKVSNEAVESIANSRNADDLAGKTSKPKKTTADMSRDSPANRRGKPAPVAAAVATSAIAKRTTTSARSLLEPASTLLFLAAGVGLVMFLVGLAVDGGRDAILAIGGLNTGSVAPVPLRFALLLDTLFPIFYGAGTAALFAALQSRGNRPLVRLVLTAILVGVGADFLENGIIQQALTGAAPGAATLSVLTVLKYGALAFAGAAGSALLPPGNSFFRLASVFVLRFLFPLAVAVVISGLAQSWVISVVGIGFVVALTLLALYARELIEG